MPGRRRGPELHTVLMDVTEPPQGTGKLKGVGEGGAGVYERGERRTQERVVHGKEMRQKFTKPCFYKNRWVPSAGHVSRNTVVGNKKRRFH